MIKKENEIHLLALLINNTLTKQFSYANGLSINKLINTIIDYPIFE